MSPSPHFGTHEDACQTLPTHMVSRIRRKQPLHWERLPRKGEEKPTDTCTVTGFLLSNAQIYTRGSWPISVSRGQRCTELKCHSVCTKKNYIASEEKEEGNWHLLGPGYAAHTVQNIVVCFYFSLGTKMLKRQVYHHFTGKQTLAKRS